MKDHNLEQKDTQSPKGKQSHKYAYPWKLILLSEMKNHTNYGQE